MRGARRAVREIRAGEPTADLSRLDKCDMVLIATPSDATAEIANSLARTEINWKAKVVLAVSGRVDSSAFAGLRTVGASVATVFPLHLFHASTSSLSGVQFAIEGEAVAVRTARKMIGSLGAEYRVVSPDQKLQASLAVSIASDFTAGVFEAAVEAAVQAGFRRKRVLPVVRELIERSLSDYFKSSKNIRPDSIFVSNGEELCANSAAARQGPRLGVYYENIAKQTVNIMRSDSERNQLEDSAADHPDANAVGAGAGAGAGAGV